MRESGVRTRTVEPINSPYALLLLSTWLLMHFLQSSIQYIQSFPDLLIGGDQRHQQTNHVAKRPGGHHKQAAAVAGSQNEPGLRVGRFLGRVVDPDDLEPDANVFFNSDTLDSSGRRGLSLRKSLRL